MIVPYRQTYNLREQRAKVRLRETLATVVITRGNSRSVFSLVQKISQIGLTTWLVSANLC